MRQQLVELLRSKNARKEKEFKIEGLTFPLNIVKKFLNEFPPKQDLLVTLDKDEDCLRFKWENGSAYINTVHKINHLKERQKSLKDKTL